MNSKATNFGLRFRGLLEDRRIAPSEFARNYGIGRTQVFNWLKRSTPPLPKHWSRLAKFFDVSENYLVTGEPQRSPNPDSQAERVPNRNYRHSGSLEHRRPAKAHPESTEMLNPPFELPQTTPARTEIEEHLKQYLDLAEKVPGGITLAFYEIKECLPLERMIKRMEVYKK